MAAGRHNLTRRALLGVVAGVCVAPSASRAQNRPLATRPASRGRRWEAALAAFRGAEARLADFAACVARLAPERRAFPACEPLEERFNDLECVRLAALRRLLRAPAQDLAAFSLKIDLAIDDQAWELTDAEPCLATLKADARRLAHQASRGSYPPLIPHSAEFCVDDFES
jgi:hypothetical protein